MKIYIANESEQSLGGAWSFKRNFEKAMSGKADVVGEISDADIVLIPGATMVSRDLVQQVKDAGKKLVLRVDNVARNSRNRNTGTTRLKDFAEMSDLIVYQSKWSRNYLKSFLGKDGPVVYNGVDTGVFSPSGIKYDFGSPHVYLYSRYSRDETKRWEEAWFRYQNIQKVQPDAKLVIVGRYSSDLVNANFDFFQGENFEYLGVVDSADEMAKIYRGCHYLISTYYNDCYSNTYQEALSCGLGMVCVNLSGGTPELLENGVIPLGAMADRYMEVFNELLS